MLALLIGAAASFGQGYGLNARPPFNAFLNGTLPSSAPVLSTDWSVEVAFPNQGFFFPLGVTPMPGTTNLVVWEREGLVWSFPQEELTTNRTMVLNITNQCQGWFECGLLGLAFHPGFETNRQMFVFYNWVPEGTVAGGLEDYPPILSTPTRNRLSRFTVDESGVAIPGSEVVLIDQPRSSLITNGGGLAFHPGDGFLYVSLGDEVASPILLNQQLDKGMFSGVLRIDVDERGGGVSHPIPRSPPGGVTGHYYIPNDNPFVGQPDALEEFYAIGLRNPHRLTIDPVTQRIFIGDVGGELGEEVNVIEPGESGLNFQWSDVEGTVGELEEPFFGTSRTPLLTYHHSEGVGRCIIGGLVYRGSGLAPELSGRYVFGDNISRNIWMLDESTQPPGKWLLATMPRGPGPVSGNDYTGISSFGTDTDGELLICQLSTIQSHLYRMEREITVGNDLPPLLSQTGIFTNLETLATSPGFIPYDVASPLWSDGAVKRRWMAVPSDAHIQFSPTNRWRFPAGSVFVKHFELPIDETDPTQLRRLETRLLITDTNDYVYGVTYRWRGDGSDAELLVSGLIEDISIQTPTGVRTQAWPYPSRQDCLSCHTGPSGGVLGVRTHQFNRMFTYPESAVTDNQIRTLNHAGYFTTPLSEEDLPSYPQLTTVTNEQVSLSVRIRSYLDSNCAHCHRPGGVQATWDARFDTPLDKQGILDGPAGDALGITDARIVAPGSPERSVMHVRMSSLASFKMPPLGHNELDEDAVEALTAWIHSMPPTPVAETIIARGSDWRFLDQDAQPGTNWLALGFNDTTWSAGPAPLGYGDGDEATTLNAGPVTSYFRHVVESPNAFAYTNLLLRLLRDDGILVYVNGEEVYRGNLPALQVTHTTPALQAVEGPEETSLFLQAHISSLFLQTGTNVVAVELHQVAANDSDASFDLELVGLRQAGDPEVRLQVERPPDGSFRVWFHALAGQTYVFEESPDFGAWLPLSTNTSVNGVVAFVQPPPLAARRFYRVRRAE